MNPIEHVRDQVIADMKTHFGVIGYRHPKFPRAIVVSRSHWTQLRREARIAPPTDPRGLGYYLSGFDIVVAPDWTCDPVTVAQARLAAALLITFRIQRIVRWLTRRMPAA